MSVATDMSLVKLPLVVITPGHAAIAAQDGFSQCPPPPPPNNGGGGNQGNGGASGGGPESSCFFVPNQYGGSMEVCT